MRMMRWIALGAMGVGFGGLATAAGCSAGDGEDLVGVAEVAITQVPSDGSVGCIKVHATGATSVTQSFGVAPGQSTTLSLQNLPTGTVRFVGDAYTGACSGVTSASVPTWLSSPVFATVGTTPVSVTLAMKQNGQATVGIDFPDASCRNTGQPCLGGSECCSGGCVKNACAAACPTGSVDCGAGCIDVTSDPNNCGACGNVCPSGACTAGACIPLCTDCGSGCVDLVIDWQNCGACGNVCASHVCGGGACLPSCGDGIQDGNETDVDCGGYCNGCFFGMKCLVDSDCINHACDPLQHVCAPTCSDGFRDGNETDVDCGGGDCPPCQGTGKRCLTNSDCATNACYLGAQNCVANPCVDSQQDGAETDIDCGGGICPACQLNQRCVADSDCVSNACDAIMLRCVSNQCADNRQDGLETDVDCGGGTCPACNVGQRCAADSDCQSGHTCTANVCQ